MQYNVYQSCANITLQIFVTHYICFIESKFLIYYIIYHILFYYMFIYYFTLFFIILIYYISNCPRLILFVI